MSQLSMEKSSKLSTNLLATLDEHVFFGQISNQISEMYSPDTIRVFKCFQDGAIQLLCENGVERRDSQILEKSSEVSSYVHRTKRAYFSNSVQRDPILSSANIDSNMNHLICIPIKSDGVILATIELHTTDREFGIKDINDIRQLFIGLESPLANMRLYLLATFLNRELLKRIESKEKELAERLSSQSHNPTINLIGRSKSFIGALEMVKKIAREDFPVHFHGDNGVGKKSMAKKLHELSSRVSKECVVVHCSAKSQEELSDNLFGKADVEGLLEKAHEGTIVLRNVEKLSSENQVRLVSVIKTGRVIRNGDNKSRNVNVRIVSTSKEGIEPLMREGDFNEDLFYSLNTISIRIPGLNERTDDLELLASHFLNQNKDEDERKTLTSAALESLRTHEWGGNLSELKNVMERTYVLAEGQYIESVILPEVNISCDSDMEIEFSESTLYDMEKIHICGTLGHLNGNKTKAAKSLGITVKTLYNKLHNYGLIQAKAN
jgi:DNA-binding NtrC family response regulator